MGQTAFSNIIILSCNIQLTKICFNVNKYCYNDYCLIINVTTLLKILNTIFTFLSSIAIIGFFVQALLYPESNVNWIYSSAIIIFVVEFLSIHSSAMMMGDVLSKNKKKNATYLFLFYLFFTVVMTVAFKNYILPFLFILSTYIKFFMVRHIQTSKTYLLVAILTLIVSLIIVSVGASFLQNLFPFPQEVLMAKPADATGVFVEVPQTVLAWGVMYFSIQFLINLFLEIKNWVLKRS